MILAGINFSEKFTYISLVQSTNRESNIINIDFGAFPGLKNSVYYKDNKLLTWPQILQEKNFYLENYIPNLHLLLSQLYEESPTINCANPSLKLNRNLENGIIVEFDFQGQKVKKNFEEILDDFFVHLVIKIRKKQKEIGLKLGEIAAVISCSEDYNEDQIRVLRKSAENAGIQQTRMIQEVISGCFGAYDLKKFDFDKNFNFLMCRFGFYDFKIYYIQYKDNMFRVLAQETSKKVSSLKVDKEIFSFLMDIYEEQNPMFLEVTDYLILEDLAETVKFFFSNTNEESLHSTKLIAKTYISYSNNSEIEECSDNLWHRYYKDVELYMDEETFEEIICNPLVSKIKKTCQDLKSKIKIQNLKFNPKKIIFTGSLANIQQFRKVIFDFFKIKSIQEHNFMRTFVKGSAIWCEKTFSLKPNKTLTKFKDEDISPNLLHSIGIQVKIPYFDSYLNQIVIPKGTFVPLENKIIIKLEIYSPDTMFTLLEGEGILPIENRVLLEIPLNIFFDEIELKQRKSKIIKAQINLDQNYILQIEITDQEKVISKLHKYIPAKTMNRKTSFSILNSNLTLKKMKLRAQIAEKIYNCESYYNSIFLKIQKQKILQKIKQLEQYKCYAQYDFFEVKKLEKVLIDIDQLLEVNQINKQTFKIIKIFNYFHLSF